jgi:hypothetical protein
VKIIEDGDTNNYTEFEIKSRTKLTAYHGYWKHIEGPESNPPVIPQLKPKRTFVVKDQNGVDQNFVQVGNEDEVAKAKQEAQPWFETDMKVFSLIMDAVPSKRLYLVKHCKTAKEAWLALRNEYRPSNTLRVTTLKSHILGYRYDYAMDVMKWREDLLNMYNTLIDLDPETLSDTDFARHVITIMPTEGDWRHVAAELSSYMNKSDASKKPLSSQYVMNMIREEHFRLNRFSEKETASIFTARIDAIGQSPQRGQKRPAIVNQVPFSPKRQRNDGNHRLERSKVQCENEYCERPRGHLKAECLAYGGGKAGQYWDGYKGPRDIHLHPDARRRMRREKELAKHSPGRSVANVMDSNQVVESRSSTQAATSNDSFEQISVAVPNQGNVLIFHAESKDDVVCTAKALNDNNPRSTKIFHDTGATRHVFNERGMFNNYEEFTNTLSVKGFDSSVSAVAVGKGSVRLIAFCDGKKTPIVLNDVLHVPAARCNLVSQSQLDRFGVHSATGNGQIHLSKSGVRFLEGKLNCDLYQLNLVPIKESLEQSTKGNSAMEAALKVFNAAFDKVDFYTAS